MDTATLDPTPKFATASLTSRAPYVSSLIRATPSPLKRLRVLGRLVTPSRGRSTTPKFGMGFFWLIQPVATEATTRRRFILASARRGGGSEEESLALAPGGSRPRTASSVLLERSALYRGGLCFQEQHLYVCVAKTVKLREWLL